MSTDPRAGRTGGRIARYRFWGLTSVGVLFLSLAWGASLPQASYGEQKVVETELKAVYLYNFLQFVQWPGSRSGSAPDEALVIGIVGDTPVSQSLAVLQNSISKGGKRPIRITQFGPWREGLDLSSCHLLFLGPSERGNFGRILAGLGGAPVLSVADADTFLESGGMITLLEDQGKLRWMINRGPADKAGLRFNAQMLRLAIKVME